MYRGKHFPKKATPKLGKSIVLLTSLVLIVCAVVSVSLAFLMDKSSSITNVFKPAEVKITVNETFDGTTKEDVTVTNTGDIPVYIRAAVVITWKDSKGNVEIADASDYSLTPATPSGWIAGGDGYYYWPSPVEKNGSTGQLIETCTAYAANAPGADYKLHVEILAEAIQSVPTSAVTDAWKVQLSGTTIDGK